MVIRARRCGLRQSGAYSAHQPRHAAMGILPTIPMSHFLSHRATSLSMRRTPIVHLRVSSACVLRVCCVYATRWCRTAVHPLLSTIANPGEHCQHLTVAALVIQDTVHTSGARVCAVESALLNALHTTRAVPTRGNHVVGRMLQHGIPNHYVHTCTQSCPSVISFTRRNTVQGKHQSLPLVIVRAGYR